MVLNSVLLPFQQHEHYSMCKVNIVMLYDKCYVVFQWYCLQDDRGPSGEQSH